MSRAIFRQAALDRLGSPEQLDDLVQLSMPWRWDPRAQVRRLADGRGWRRSRGLQPQRVKTPTVLQMEATECGAAALGSVLAFHGRSVPLEQLRVECGVSRDGSKASNMIKAARDHGLLAKGFTKDPAGLATLPLPLIVFWNFNHFVVVEGFGAQRVYLNDPASGPRVVSAEEFDAGFTGVVLVFVPGPEFVRTTRDSQYSLPGALRQNLRGSEWALALLLLASLAMAAPGLLLPVLTGMFVDNVLIQRSYGEVGRLLTGLALVGLVQVALTFGQGSILVWLDNRLSTSTSHQFFRHLLRLPIGFFTQRYAGEIAGRVALNDRVARLLTGDLATAALSGLLVVAYVVLMARFDLLLAVIGTGGAVINLAVVRASSRRRLDGQHRLQQDHGKLMGATFATLQMIDTVKATGAESDAFARWAGHHARVVNAEHAMALANQVMSVVPRLITGLTVTATLVLGGVRVMNGDLSAGTLVAFQGLLLGFFQPFNQLMALSSALQEATAGRLRIDDVLRAPADPLLERSAASTAGPESDVRLRGPVALRGVTFGYSPRGPALIKDFDLTIPVAGWVALVGSSASGKSTVARLVAGLYQPWSGEILFDGLPVAEVARSVLTRSLAMVDQDVTLFAGSIRDNLTLWDDSVGPEELDRAARDAEIHADILALDGGYDAVLVEQGRNLSGGQRQRLAIARALVRNPTILVLDEATSALDPVTEQRVMDNLRRRGCQCLIVAHRLSTIRDADQILVLEDGEVVEQGTHASLTHAGGAYARLIAAEPVSTLTGAQAANGRPDSHQPGLDGSGATAILAPSVLHAETRAVPESDERATDGDVCLLAACRLVGDALGIVVRSSPVPSGGDPLANISRASRVRTRQVLLRDGWWRADCGPLLGYTAQDRTPVALLPAAAGPYSLADPCTGVSTSITAESATSLSPAAVMFYRPLPERIVSAWDLLRLGISGGRRDVARLLVAGALGGLLALATPVAIGYLFDLILPTGQWPLLVSMGLVLSAATLAVAAFAVAENIALVRMNGRTDAVTQAAVWDRVLRLPPTSFGKFEIGDLGQRAMGIATIRQVVSDSAIVAVLAAIFSVFSLGLLVVYDARLALVALGLVLVFAVTTGVMGRRALDYQRRIGAAQGRLAGLAVQLIGGITQLRTAGAELRAYGRWAALFGAHKRLALQAGRERSLLSAWDAGFPALALVILYMLVALGGTVDLSTGSLIAFTAAFAQFMAAAIGLSVSIMSLVSVVPLYERMRPILETAPEVHVTGLHPGELGGAIKLDHVTFRYHTAGPVVLDDVSLEINPGECVALVGPSGSGKSTLLRLLLGFERPDVGTILYDGRPLHTLDVQAVRRQLGVVLQNGSVTADDIYHNIVGSAPLGVDAAWQAATMAGLDAEIRALPMGMYTLVSEGGTTFSAGQRQRLSIARALVARPRVVLFDEATSALDNATQSVVSQSLADLQATRVLVAHRLSTVMHADRIVVLRAGRIVQSGQYDELMQADGLFAELARQQVV